VGSRSQKHSTFNPCSIETECIGLSFLPMALASSTALLPQCILPDARRKPPRNMTNSSAQCCIQG